MERQQAPLLAEPDRERAPGGARRPGGRRRGRRRNVRRPVRDPEREFARDDERPCVEGVRRDERDRHRVESPHEHRPAVRQVVGGRAGWGRADHPVARLDAEISPPSSQPSSTIRPGRPLVATASLIADASRRPRDVERGSSTHPVLARERARHAALELVGLHARQEADPAEVDAEDRHVRTEERVRAREYRAVAAEHDRDVHGPLGAAPGRARASASPTRIAPTARRRGGVPAPASSGSRPRRDSRSSRSAGARPGLAEVEEELMVSPSAPRARARADGTAADQTGNASTTSRRTRRCARGSRTTRPSPTSAWPASNCGLTSASACQPGAAHASTGGSALSTR